MGGGKGGGNSGSKKLEKIAKNFYDETTPLRQEMQDQFLEALTTGGVEARIPMVNKAVESSRQATSNTLRQLDTQLAQSGLAGTPFGQQIQTQALQSGNQQTAGVPFNIIAQLLQQIPGYVTGANQTVVTGLGQAAGAQAQQTGADASMLGALLSPFNFKFS